MQVKELEMMAKLAGMTYADGLYYGITNNDAVIFLINFKNRKRNSILHKFEQLSGYIKIVGKAKNGFTFSNWKCKTLDLSEFDTSKMTTMSYMFSGCAATELDLSNFNTSNVTDMSYMFSDCDVNELNLSNFNTSNVTNMSDMFHKCSTSKINLSSFNTSNVNNMKNIFTDCNALAINLSSSFNIQKVKNIYCIKDKLK